MLQCEIWSGYGAVQSFYFYFQILIYVPNPFPSIAKSANLTAAWANSRTIFAVQRKKRLLAAPQKIQMSQQKMNSAPTSASSPTTPSSPPGRTAEETMQNILTLSSQKYLRLSRHKLIKCLSNFLMTAPLHPFSYQIKSVRLSKNMHRNFAQNCGLIATINGDSVTRVVAYHRPRRRGSPSPRPRLLVWHQTILSNPREQLLGMVFGLQKDQCLSEELLFLEDHCWENL